jgi:Rieske Fe-S protein
MKAYILLFFITFLLFSCNSKDDYIQDVYVNFELDLSLPEYSELVALGNSITITGGNKGIIIYHFFTDEYRVYDRNCSYEPSLACSYIDSINSTIAYCGCCTSAFILDQDGAVANSPALLPLKQYKWTLNSSNILRVFY